MIISGRRAGDRAGRLRKGCRRLRLLQMLEQGASQSCLSTGEIAFPELLSHSPLLIISNGMSTASRVPEHALVTQTPLGAARVLVHPCEFTEETMSPHLSPRGRLWPCRQPGRSHTRLRVRPPVLDCEHVRSGGWCVSAPTAVPGKEQGHSRLAMNQRIQGANDIQLSLADF